MAKKILALLLAIMMIAALSVSAFAEDPVTGSITIENKSEFTDPKYTAFKIFNVTYDSGKTSYAYTIKSNSLWLATVQSFFDTEAAAADDTVLVVTPKDDYSAAAFAAALKTAYDDMTDKPSGTTLAGAGEEPLDLGYWFVMTSTGALCNLTTTDPSSTIYDKNEPAPFDKDETSTTITGSVQLGDVIPYAVTGKVPVTTGYTKYTYKVSDNITGAVFNKDVAVKFGSTTITPTAAELVQTATGFTLTMDMTKYQAYKTQAISITYSATVDDSSLAAGGVANTATLQHSHDPQNADDLQTEPTVKVITKTFTVDLTKVAEDETTPLKDAKFVLKNSAGKYYTYDSTNKKVVWVDSEEGAMVVTTGDDGKGDKEFAGLNTGTYSLVEINSPRGYKLPKDPFAVVITEGKAHEDSDEDGNITKWYEYTATVDGEEADIDDLSAVATAIANEPGKELPETGGIGTTIFYVVGSLFVIGAAVVLLTKKRA